MAKMINTNPRICEICKIIYERKPTYPVKQFNIQRTCSGKCRSILLKQMNVGFKKGHPVYSEKGRFVKGQEPHNKGQKGIQKAWNKGIKMTKTPWNKGRHLSEETIKKIRDARAKQIIPKGHGHPNWKGGLSALRKTIQNLYQYKDWRRSIFERDNWTCQHCNVRGGTIHADHIKSYSSIIKDNNIMTVEDAKKCLELWDINNGRTLCIKCHMATDNYGGKSIKKVLLENDNY